MALPSKKIFLRSPYWVSKSRPNLEYIVVKLWVWTGDLTADEPTDPSLELRSTAFEGVAEIDIAEFARDQIEVVFAGTEDSSAVWVKSEITWFDNDGTTTGTDSAVYYTGLDGFSYFEEGSNYNYPYQVLTGSEILRAPANEVYRIPVLQDDLYGYGLQYWNGYAWFEYHTVIGLTPVEDTDNVVRYVDTLNSGIYAERVEFRFNTAPTEYRYIEYQECTMYDPIEVFFVNRYGAIQELNCFGRFDVSMNTSEEKYKRNLAGQGGSYNTTRHQHHTLYKNGKIKFTINTGWYDETENDTFTEMMLSEQVWVRVDKDQLGIGWLPKTGGTFIVPVNLTSQELKLKKRRADKLINYTFEFEAASDRINSVR